MGRQERERPLCSTSSVLSTGQHREAFSTEEETRVCTPTWSEAGIENEMVGFVFQFLSPFAGFHGSRNIMIPRWIKRAKPAEALGAAEEFLEIMGARRPEASQPGELSGGEQQRVAIARALIQPTGADPLQMSQRETSTGRRAERYCGTYCSIRERIGRLVTRYP